MQLTLRSLTTESATPLVLLNPFFANPSATLNLDISTPYRDLLTSSFDMRYWAAASKWSCLMVMWAVQFLVVSLL